MVLLLSGNITTQMRIVGPAYRENRIPLLPAERSVSMSFCPGGGGLLDFAHQVCWNISSAQADEQVDVIFDTAYLFGHSAQTPNGAAQIFVQVLSPGGPN